MVEATRCRISGMSMTETASNENGSATASASLAVSYVDPFPAALLAASGDYIHFAAEDAGGEIWTARHGLPLAIDRSGTPVLANGYLNCANGCYSVTRTAWPEATPFTLWAITGGNRPAGKDFYNGPASYSNSVSALQFYSSSRVDVGATRFNRQWTLPAASGPESVEWSKPAPASGQTLVYLSAWNFWHNGASVPSAMGDDRSTRSDGNTFVIGGTRNSAGANVPGGTQIRDVLLTVGWTLSDAQRAALEQYRLTRIA